MKEEDVIAGINAAIDAALEQAEAALLRLDTNRNTVQISGKFLRPVSPRAESNTTVSASQATLSPGQSASSFSATKFEQPEPEEVKKNSRARRRMNVAPTDGDVQGVDVFRFPLRGEDSFLNQKDQVYSDVDESRVLIVRHLNKDTRADEEGLKKISDYYKLFGPGKQCRKCNRVVVQESGSESEGQTQSLLNSSVVSPTCTTFSVQTETNPGNAGIADGATNEDYTSSTLKGSTSTFTTSRISSSVVTEPSGLSTDLSSSYASNVKSKPFCQSTNPSNALTTTSETLHSTFSSPPSGTESLAVSFSTKVLDPKTRKKHPINFIAKCIKGEMPRVYINGKAFGPRDD